MTEASHFETHRARSSARKLSFDDDAARLCVDVREQNCPRLLKLNSYDLGVDIEKVM